MKAIFIFLITPVLFDLVQSKGSKVFNPRSIRLSSVVTAKTSTVRLAALIPEYCLDTHMIILSCHGL
ncbi:hypothetical protein MJO28_003037 [Puccinia striiformis f. sp. tritici]|uniref:Uncharacterized protein n=1 Tax=Puccinia striiformis f. sp. tritici TaxID=168172 RepID=A0ACC0ERB1_9BASI|nr:hypothetical protein MJO28_003037 [Puccinia striiformis f. sp. tritici]